MKKALPVTYPLNNTYPQHANLWACCEQDLSAWLLQSYIPIATQKEIRNGIRLDFEIGFGCQDVYDSLSVHKKIMFQTGNAGRNNGRHFLFGRLF